MAKLDVRHVVRNRLLAFGRRDHVGGRHEQELGLRIDEPLDQPGTRHAVDVCIRASDPLHSLSMDSSRGRVEPITLVREEGWLWRRPLPWKPTALPSDTRPACSRLTTSTFA